MSDAISRINSGAAAPGEMNTRSWQQLTSGYNLQVHFILLANVNVLRYVC